MSDDILPPGYTLWRLSARFDDGVGLEMLGPIANGVWTIRLQEYPRQRVKSMRRWHIKGYYRAKLRFDEMCERLGRGLEVDDEP